MGLDAPQESIIGRDRCLGDVLTESKAKTKEAKSDFPRRILLGFPLYSLFSFLVLFNF